MTERYGQSVLVENRAGGNLGAELVARATSDGSVLLLGDSFEEVCRVLKPDGMFLGQISLVPGPLPYDPFGAPLQLADELHVPHFDSSWFESLFLRHFDVEDVPPPANSSFFYVARQKRDRRSLGAPGNGCET